ncbi:MAG: RidA family protein [Limnochordales bacterium]|nr:RidA family protein [Limnochordales bacterium]
MGIRERLKELSIELPPTPPALGAYLPAVRVGEWVYTSGQLPLVGGVLQVRGRLGQELSVEEGYQAARVACLNALAAAAEVTDLDLIERVVKVTGYVASAPGFHQQPAVINGASQLLLDIFGEAGRHARAAVGVAELPQGAPVEIELVLLVRSGG